MTKTRANDLDWKKKLGLTFAINLVPHRKINPAIDYNCDESGFGQLGD